MAETLEPALARAVELLRTGEGDRAIAELQRVCASAPASLTARNALGSGLAAMGRRDEAIAAFQQALALKPADAVLRTNLGSVLVEDGQLLRAITAFEAAVATGLAPAQARLGLGRAYQLLGRSALAAATFERAVHAAGAGVRSVAQSRHCYASLLDPDCDAQHVLQVHRQYAALAGDAGRSEPMRVWPPRRAGTRLVLGYVSADFREHSVTCFIEGVLAAHDRSAVEVVLYSDVLRPDSTTERLRALVDRHQRTAQLSDAQLAQRVLEDGVDVLVDLGGHMQPSRLPVFARRPAPVLLTYLGYPGSTGMSVFDGRLTDAWADPWGDPQRAGPEPLLLVPGGYFAYTAPADAPAVAPLPAARSGHVTLGCFNDALKLNDRVLHTFATILTRAPGTRLLLKAAALASRDVCDRVRDVLTARGVEPERIELLQFCASRREHLATYARIDIALDTFPYAGATTSCEALYMGVPVLTLAGDRHAGRMGVSILSAVGLPSWIAPDIDAYVRIALEHCTRIDALSALRSELRARLVRSSLYDGVRVARYLETCAGELRARR